MTTEETQHADPAALIRSIGTPEDFLDAAEEPSRAADRLKSNSHIHLPPNFSAFDSVAAAVEQAAAEDVRLVGVTNYYDHRVYGEFARRARGEGIFPLFGLEIIATDEGLADAGTLVNDPNNPGRYYLCGKGAPGVFDPPARARDLLDRIRAGDTRRMAEMCRRVGAVFAAAGVDITLDGADVIAMVVDRHGCPPDSVTIQERHIAMAYQQRLFETFPRAADRPDVLARVAGTAPEAETADDPVALQGFLRSRLMKAGRPAFVEEAFLSLDEAQELILALGAIPCYPTLADGTAPICGYEDPVDRLIDNLRDRNIHLAEFIPTRNSPAVLGDYARALRAAGIAVVGGTEHNTATALPIEPRCAGGVPVPADVADMFREGMFVAAAHQFLTAHGRPGFVDAAGNPAGDFDAAEDRIRRFAAVGAAVVRAYRQTAGEDA